jgi:hypothetical protein
MVGSEESNYSEEAEEAEEIILAQTQGGVWKRTSYNTIGGVHQYGGKPFRKNYASEGYTYDYERDAFIAPKTIKGWVLNEDTCLWEPPTPMPDNGYDWDWDEETEQWVETDRPL